MAQVPLSPGPQVAPSTAPTPTLNVPVEPQAFGANVAGEALGQTGKAATEVSSNLIDYAQRFQAINNKQAADTAFVRYTTTASQMWEDFKAHNVGVGPDGQPAAVTNLPTFYKDLEALRVKTGEGMSPLAQVEYDANTRRSFQYMQSEAVNFAATERKGALVNTQKALIVSAQNDAAAHLDDEGRVATDVAQIAKAHATLSQPDYLGLPEEEAKNALRQDVGAVYASGIKVAIDAGDIPKAQALFDKHRDDMTFEQATAVAGALKGGANDFIVKGFADDIVAGNVPQNRAPVVAGAIRAGDSAGLKSAIIGEESGGNVNVRPSSQGAVGVGQITPATFAQFAKPGEVITNPADNRAVSGRILDHYLAQYNGDPARAAVAYFSGPGNVAPAGSATPWKHNTHDANGTTVEQYVGGVINRMGGAAPAIPTAKGEEPQAVPASGPPPPPPIRPNEDPAQIKADYDTYIVQAAQARFGDNPTLMYRAIESARNMMAVKIQGIATEQTAAHARLEQAIVGGTAQGTAISQMSDLNHAYAGAANDLALQPPGGRTTLQEDINRAAAGFGAFKTPEMDANAVRLEGLRGMNSAAWLGTDLTKENLSAADKIRFIGQQIADRRDQARMQQNQAKINTYLADPLVSQIVKQNWPSDADKQTSGYASFIGALDGIIQKKMGESGKPPSPDDIRSAAQQLVRTKTSWWGGTTTEVIPVPDAAAARIRSVYQQNLHRDPSPDELARDYQMYYAGH